MLTWTLNPKPQTLNSNSLNQNPAYRKAEVALQCTIQAVKQAQSLSKDPTA